jgi:hypothetical protein
MTPAEFNQAKEPPLPHWALSLPVEKVFMIGGRATSCMGKPLNRLDFNQILSNFRRHSLGLGRETEWKELYQILHCRLFTSSLF